MTLILAIPFFLAVFAAASMGMLFPTGDWYKSLRKPRWTPPNWLFPVAWTLLYIAIAIVGWRLAIMAHFASGIALGLWGLQMVLNAIWTPTVFGARRLFAGVIVILALWLTIVSLTALSFEIDPISGWLLVPYLIWVSFAACLNIALWRMNPPAKD